MSLSEPNVLTTSHEGGGGFKVPTSKARADLTDRMHSLSNPAYTHQEDFEHMQ